MEKDETRGVDPARPPTSAADFCAACRHFDFVHVLFADLHAHPHTCFLPADAADSLVSHGADLPMSLLGHTIDGGVASIPDLSHASDVILRPLVETARECPGRHDDCRVLQVLARPEWLTGDPIAADPRSMALHQLERLHSRGLDLLWGAGCEFRLFETQHGPNGCPEPACASMATSSVHVTHQFERTHVQLDRRMRAVGGRLEGFRSGPELGQMKATVAPDWGIKAADDLFRFRTIARHVAKDSGFRASFMTRPLLEQTGNALHFNHSVCRRDGDENVLFDADDVDKLSPFARRWIAGLLHHAGALTALCCPTVNCYRRLQQTHGPHFASWGCESGTAAVSVKLRSEKRRTVLESRLPTSAANPYLVLASCIAAGLDGVDRELPLAAEGSREMGPLPRSLTQALEALRKDDVITAELGEQFVEWYFIVKLEEIGKLKTDDISWSRGTDFEHERKIYFSNV